MDFLIKVLYVISSGLMVPVVLCLILLLIYMFIALGYHYAQRKEFIDYSKYVSVDLSQGKVDSLVNYISSRRSSAILFYFAQVIEEKDSHALREYYLNSFELYVNQRLSIFKNIAKLGPVVGLMGTLIPMGPALSGLAQGDIATMAQNMQIAFSTTVIGLLIGYIGFYLVQSKSKMYFHYLRDLELIDGLYTEKIASMKTLFNENLILK
ncbi:MAG: MotA/TolQ/ExbB proton channel family protein [Bacteroidales bacterium]|nr:MotA/TolQ/ExbB proton channel family protein [Bacteroidales bacterium]